MLLRVVERRSTAGTLRPNRRHLPFGEHDPPVSPPRRASGWHSVRSWSDSPVRRECGATTLARCGYADTRSCSGCCVVPCWWWQGQRMLGRRRRLPGCGSAGGCRPRPPGRVWAAGVRRSAAGCSGSAGARWLARASPRRGPATRARCAPILRAAFCSPRCDQAGTGSPTVTARRRGGTPPSGPAARSCPGRAVSCG